MKLCKCGCGNQVSKESNNYLRGHFYKGTHGLVKHSEETIKKMSEVKKGKKHSEEAKRKIAAYRKGKITTEETKIKLSLARKGSKMSEESKLKISESHKGKIISEETKQKISKALKGKKGHNLTEETKQKLRECHKGKVLSQETKNKISKLTKGIKNGMFGKKHSEETKKKISGKNHYNYNPYLTNEHRQDIRTYPEYGEWRDSVFKRDNYICKCCGQKGGYLTGHHLFSYANNYTIRTKVENGITLCKKCHIQFHKEYGFGNNTKKQLYVFMLDQR